MAKEIERESIFDVAVEILFLAIVFLAPVIFDRRVGIVFSLTKVTTIRLLIIGLLTVWSVKLMLKQEHKFIRTPLDFPVLAYALSATVACLTSVHVLVSFIGFYGRYEGLSTLWMYCLLFFVAVNFITTKERIMRVMYTVSSASVIMGIYGVIQRMGLDPYAWGGVTTWANIIATIGQPNFYAAYADMALIITFALLLNLKDMRWEKPFDAAFAFDILIRLALISIVALNFTCLMFTQSRGGSLGILTGISLFIVLNDRRVVLRKWRELSILAVCASIVVLSVFLSPTASIFRKVSGEVERTVEMSQRETPIVGYNSTLSRIETWKSAFRIIVDRPFFGIGEEVLKMVFPRYETDKFRFYEGFHVKQDRCHNEVCDMAVTRGALTLAIYVWLLGTFFYMGVRITRGDYDPALKLFTASFLGASAAYFVQNQFSFGVVAITTLVWVMMGITSAIYVKAEPSSQKRPPDISNMPWLVLAAVILAAIFLSYISTIQFRADIHYKNAKSLADIRRFDDAIKQFERSLKISPYEGGTWTHYGISSLNLAQYAQDKAGILRSIDIFKTANRLDPYNADNFYIAGRAFFILSYMDPGMLENVISSEKKAIAIDPLYAEAFQIIGAVYERQGKAQEAANMYERTIEINPMIGEAISGLSNIYLKMGRSNKVIEIFKGFLEKYPNNPVFQENLAAIYARRGEDSKAMEIYKQMIATNPANVRALVNLGFMYARTGEITKAKDSFDSAVMADPKSVDAHNGLGTYYMQTGQTEKAKDEFNQTLSVDPNNQYAKQMMEKIK